MEDKNKADMDEIKTIKNQILTSRLNIRNHKKVRTRQTLLLIEEEMNTFGLSDLDKQKPKNKPLESEADGFADYKKALEEASDGLFKEINQKYKNAYRKVDVVFNGKPIGFLIHARETFGDLSKKVASYIGLKAEEVFFGDSGNSNIYQVNENVFYELFNWKRVTIRFKRPRLIVMESKSETENYIDKIYQEEVYISSESKLIENTEVEKITQKDQYTTIKVNKRYNRNCMINLLQSLLLLGFWIMWTFTIINDQNIHNSSWMNETVSRVLLREKLSEETNSIFNDKPNTNYYKIHSEQRFWAYLYEEKNRLHQVQESGMDNFNYNYEALELRQVRSDLKTCEVEEYGTVLCLEKHSSSPNKDDFSTKGEGFVYDSDGKSVYIVGGIDNYNSDGFKLELSFSDLASWSTDLLRLITERWIDTQTRAVFMTTNIVNPFIGFMTTSVQVIEIGPHGNYVPNIKLYPFNYDIDYLAYAFFHGILLVWVIVLLAFELRNNCLSYDEVVFTEKREYKYLKESLSPELLEKEMKKILENWRLTDKKKLMHRFRKPRMLEFVQISVLLLVLLLSLGSDSWFLATMGSLEVNEDEYTNILKISQAYAWVRDCKLIIGILLACLLCKALPRQLGFLEDFIYMLQDVLLEVWPLILFIYGLLVLFSSVLHYVFGPYHYFAWNFQLSFIQCIWMMFGYLDLGFHFYMFHLHWEVYTIVILTRMLSFVVFLTFIVSLYSALLKVRTLQFVKIRKENKARNRVLKL